MKKTIQLFSLAAMMCLFSVATFAQQNYTFSVNNKGKKECVRMNVNENDGTYSMSLNFPRTMTEEVETYLTAELGNNFTTHTGSLKRWSSMQKRSNIQGFKVSLSNGYIKIKYDGGDEDALEEVKALAREVKAVLKDEA